MKVGDLVKDNFYGHIGIVVEEGGTSRHGRVYLVAFPHKKKWIEADFISKRIIEVINESR